MYARVISNEDPVEGSLCWVLWGVWSSPWRGLGRWMQHHQCSTTLPTVWWQGLSSDCPRTLWSSRLNAQHVQSSHHPPFGNHQFLLTLWSPNTWGVSQGIESWWGRNPLGAPVDHFSGWSNQMQRAWSSQQCCRSVQPAPSDLLKALARNNPCLTFLFLPCIAPRRIHHTLPMGPVPTTIVQVNSGLRLWLSHNQSLPICQTHHLKMPIMSNHLLLHARPKPTFSPTNYFFFFPNSGYRMNFEIMFAMWWLTHTIRS